MASTPNRQHFNMTPASISPAGSTCGYESPTDETHGDIFGTDSGQSQRPLAGRPTVTISAPTSRPAFVSRPSYMVAVPPDPHRSRMSSSPTSHQSSLNDMLHKAKQLSPRDKVGIRDRIACYKWTYFTMTMATGGVANILHTLPFQASWITGIGTFFFLLNILLFLTNCILISTRFYLRPGSFVHSFTDQVESLFIPAFFVSIAIIMITICEYGVPNCGVWLLRAMEFMFWIYVGLGAIASAGMYLILWSTLVFPVHMMTPTWVFPAYPLLLTAPLAANLIEAANTSQHPLSVNTVAVAFGAATAQGTGCLIAFMISAAFLYRLMTQKLPRDMQRPGVFISIGPFGFTAAGITQLGSQANHILPANFLDCEHTADIIRIVSLLVGLWLWGLSMWFFLVSVGSLWKYVRSGHSMPFQMTWWSFIFPNTALVTATDVMANVFDNHGLRIFGATMTGILIVVWIAIFATMIRCLKDKKLLYPKDNS